MWILYATGSAFFAGITSILAKCGISKIDSDVATAIRTIVVLVFSWILVLLTGTISTITDINSKTLLFLVLSGIATGASWLCYFKALQNGDVNKVVPIDKSSTILTILLALIFFHEGLSFVKIVCVCLIGLGTMLMMNSMMYLLSVRARAISVRDAAIPCWVSTQEKMPAFIIINRIMPVVLAVENKVSFNSLRRSSL